jgi:hypothetical protein
MVGLRNQFVLMTGRISESTGATSKMGAAIQGLKTNLPAVVASITAATTAFVLYRGALVSTAIASAVLTSTQTIAAFVALAKTVRSVADAGALLNAAGGGWIKLGAVIAGAAASAAVYIGTQRALAKATEDATAQVEKETSATTALGQASSALNGSLDASKAATVDRIALMTELAGMVQLSTAEVMELSGAESKLLTRLLAGNVSLEQRVKLNKELLAVQGAVSAQFDMMLSKPPTALAATATEGRAPIVPKAVSINPAIIAQVRANADAMGREMDAAAKSVLDRTGINITEQFTSIFADALGAGFEAAFATGKISDGFKAFGKAMLSGLGGMLQAFGTQTLLASQIMKQIMVSFATLNPVQMAAAGIALIALGGALKGSASSIFGGGSAGGGDRVASYSTSSSAMTAPRLPTLTYGPTSAAGAAGLSPMAATNITIIGPNDPVAQRAMQELITKANRRGNV